MGLSSWLRALGAVLLLAACLAMVAGCSLGDRAIGAARAGDAWIERLTSPPEVWVVPAGREAAIMAWLAPLRRSGLAGLAPWDVSIESGEIRVSLVAPRGTAQAPAAGCALPPWARGPGALVLERASEAQRSALGEGSNRHGRVHSRWLRLGWSICAEGIPETIRGDTLGQAARLAEDLAAADPDVLWERRRAPPREAQRPWQLVVALALLAGGIAMLRRRIAIAFAVAGSALLSMWLRGSWESPLVSLAWLTLPALAVVALTRIARQGRRSLLLFSGYSLAALAARAGAPHVPANWYVDYLAPASVGQQAFVRATGGLSGLFRVLSSAVAIRPGLVLAGSVLLSSASVGLLVCAFERHERDSRRWPPHTPLLWGVFLALDVLSCRLGASDAPHNFALFAFALGFWFYAEALSKPRTAPPRFELAAIFASSALVGLTRAELVLGPLAYPLLLVPSRRGKPLPWQPLLATLLGTTLASSIAIRRTAGHLTLYHPTSWGEVVKATIEGSPFLAHLEPLPEIAAPIAVSLFLAYAIRKGNRALLLAFAGSILLGVPKVAGRFGGRIGPVFEPQVRYAIILIPLVLLIQAAGIAWPTSRLADQWRLSRRLRAAIAALALSAYGTASVALTAVAALRPPLAFQAEYEFLHRRLAELPRGTVIAGVWLADLTNRDLDTQLAMPHALLQYARPDLRWIVLKPGDPIPAERPLAYYEGASCSLDPAGHVTSGMDYPADRDLVRRVATQCAALHADVSSWVARDRVAVRSGTWPLRDDRVDLGIGWLAE